MKSFRGTLFSDLQRVAKTLEAKEDMREVLAKHAITQARGPERVKLARAKLRKLKQERHQRIMRGFRREMQLLLADRYVRRAKVDGDDTSVDTVAAWVDAEQIHLLYMLLM